MARPGERRHARGPGAVFWDHHGVYALSLAGALGAAGYAAIEARRAEPRRAAWWWLLVVVTSAQAAGVMVARRRARPHVPAGGS